MERSMSGEEAEVVAVEADAKRHGMYRVALRIYGGNRHEAPQEHDEDFPEVPKEEDGNFPETYPEAFPAEFPGKRSGKRAGKSSGKRSGMNAGKLSRSLSGNHSEERADGRDWNDEVDALIASAAKPSSSAGASETVVTVHEDTLVALRLLKGRRLSPEEWEGLRQEESKEDAYRAALGILERKARTSREVSEALKRKGYAPEIVRSCLERLQQRRMLDDSFYARRYAEQRATGQRKGSRLIKQELLQKGITREEADNALGALDRNVEKESALALARKKWPQTKGEPRERRHKVAAFLLRRGFPGGIAKEAVDRVSSDFADEGAEDAEFSYDADETSLNADWESVDAGGSEPYE